MSDSLFIFEMTQGRFSFMTADGTLTRTRAVSTRLSGFIDLLDDNSAVAAEPAFQRAIGERLVNLPMVVRVVDLASGRADTIVEAGRRQEVQSLEGGERIVMTPVPFTVHPVVVVRDHDIYVMDGIVPEIRVYNRAGALLRVIRVGGELEPVRQSEYDAFVRKRIGDAAPERQGDLRRIYRRMPVPPTKPPYDEMSVTEDGRVWVRHFNADSTEHRVWTVFEQSGRAVARVRTPTSLRIMEIGPGYLMGVSVDDLGIEYVHRYALPL